MKIDTDKIKKLTNQKIGYDNYEKEIQMKKNRLKNICCIFALLVVFSVGGYTVDAMSGNTISNNIKDLLNIKVDGKDYNANCKKQDGNIKCTLDESVLGEGSSAEVNVAEEYADKVDINYENGELDTTIKE